MMVSKMKIVIWGYGSLGATLYMELIDKDEYEVIGFADNSTYKQGNFVNNLPIMPMIDLIKLKETTDYRVIIASGKWFVIGVELEKLGIPIEGIYQNGEITKYDRMCFERLDLSRPITLYAGDIGDDVHRADLNLYGLSINKSDSRHIFHDITYKYPLPDSSIFSYMAEDVLEHIDYNKLPDTINEIWRVLKQGSLFRICLPDYFSPYLDIISMKDKDGKILFDPAGGGNYGESGVSNGGHVWFPNYFNVKALLEKTKFRNWDLLCYHTENGELVRKEIDFSKGYIKRVPQYNDQDKPVYSIVVDCYK